MKKTDFCFFCSDIFIVNRKQRIIFVPHPLLLSSPFMYTTKKHPSNVLDKKYGKILFKKGSIENGCTLVNYGYFVELNLQRDIFLHKMPNKIFKIYSCKKFNIY